MLLGGVTLLDGLDMYAAYVSERGWMSWRARVDISGCRKHVSRARRLTAVGVHGVTP
jgi:hypothetical protein